MKLATLDVKEHLENIQADKRWYDGSECRFDTDYRQNVNYLSVLREVTSADTEEEYYLIPDLYYIQLYKMDHAPKCPR